MGRLGAMRGFTSRASKLVDLAWREMVQLAAETLGDDGSLRANSADMSRAAKRYREMRQECVKNMARLAKLEQDPPAKKIVKVVKAAPKAAPIVNKTKEIPAKQAQT